MSENWPKGLPIPDGEEWDHEGDGMPGLTLLANAVQVWSCLQNRQTTVQECAAAFNIDEDQARKAVQGHYWMYLNGDNIEHEGE